ncbi:MAG: hypothetical protein HZB72_09085 [Burkholderiales bacterium]|nr:hypothetical protein [Burkholderiales bacterium]
MTAPAPSADAPSEALRAHLHDKRHQLQYRLELSALYHQKRARFFDLVDKLSTFIAVAGSTSAVAVVMGAGENSWVYVCFSAVVALVSTVTLVFAPSTKARDHYSLGRDYRHLIAELHAEGDYPRAEVLDQLGAKCAQLEAEEPAALNGLVVECENLLRMAHTGKPVAKLPRPKRWLIHFCDITPPPPIEPTAD